MNKCVDKAGRVTYQDGKCPDSTKENVLSSPSPGSSTDAPRRKSGLWQLKQTGDHWPPPGLESHECVDHATDSFPPKADNNCGDPKFHRQGSDLVFLSSCKIDNTTLTQRIVVRGSLDNAYTEEWSLIFRPEAPGHSNSRTTIQARWLGAACKPGMTPGDSVLLDTPRR
jgi:hypothetical protein